MKSKNSQGTRARTSRRKFTKAVAAALVAAPVAASAQTTPAPKQEPKAPPNPQPAQQTPAQPSPVAVAYAEVARARFGKQVSEDEFNRIRRDLEGNVRTGERLAAFKLQNWDEPDFIFNA